MKKIYVLFLFTSLLFFYSMALAQYDDDIVEDLEEPIVDQTWTLVGVDFPKRLMTNKKTGKKVVPVTATFKYESDGEDISFNDNYIWSMMCSITPKGTYESVYSQKILFPTGAKNGVGFDNGDSVSSTIRFEFDPKLVKTLRKGANLACSFGWDKGNSYQSLNLEFGQGIYPSYLLTLKGYRWEVKGWNF